MVAPAPRPPEQASPQARYFVGLRPAPAVRARLHRLALSLAARHGGRPVAAARIHLTLAFLGQTPRALEPALLALLRTQPAAGPLRLERLGSFGPRLLWAGPLEIPAWLAALSAGLRSGLDALGADYDRKPLRPHVTLLRSAHQGPDGGDTLRPFDFGPSQLMLVESITDRPGGHYRWISP
ncbi:RNA 2',3'-cyclic phosphodiesterase [Quisquiliibacterium transsilvanicum]|uniref:2'-5' RNA ligase n=1 Tax=Quisquiliibacterium transsilvanicum TaxID=1549638 RepID=A0A7W8HGA8_9BURK|nr:RNA 2',3'-cyclic phosphodiesterase [Quisquiliibacterium transsilvanicum]MBB5271460.1 2'-5' RNA ligase [Quisquiliibacterium transsilvanicum]